MIRGIAMIKSAVISGCVIAICSSIADLALVGDKLRNEVKKICAIILIIAVAVPVMKLDLKAVAGELSKEFTELSGNADAVFSMSDAVKAETERKLSEFVSSRLKSLSIIPKDISIELTVYEDNLIELERITVILSESDYDKASLVKETLVQDIPSSEISVKWEAENSAEAENRAV